MTASPQRPDDNTPQSRIHIEQKIENVTESVVTGNIGGDLNLYQNIHQTTISRTLKEDHIPRHYVERQKPFEAVKAMLLSESAPNTLVVSAIHGLGGIGKSVLAAAIACDPVIKKRFPDGVYWIGALGHEPDLVSWLELCIHEIEGNTSYRANGTDAVKIASTALRSRLQDKRVLIVVDDVWNAAHVDPFRVGGAGSCLLVTTREAQIRDAQRYDLDVMTAAEARTRIEKSLPQSFSAEEEQAVEAFTKAVGYLPLALDLAVAQIQDGVTWPELLAELRSEMVGLAVLHDLSQDEEQTDEKLRKYSLQASFNVSLKRLSAQELTCLRWLGVLPEDVAINHRMATTLWDCSEREAKRVLRRFRLKALLQDDQKLLDGTPTYRFHDLVHQTARELLIGKQLLADAADGWPEAGIEFVEAQRQLLERYSQQTQDGLWHTLPHDHYIHAHLTWHFEQANQAEAIHDLLREETLEGRNGWFEACEQINQTSIFVSNIKKAWSLAAKAAMDKASSERAISLAISQQVRYALMRSTLNNLSDMPPEFMVALVRERLWTLEQAIIYGNLIKDPAKRSVCFSKIIEAFKEQENLKLDKLIELVKGIKSEERRTKALYNLPIQLQESSISTFTLFFESVGSIQDEYCRARALFSLGNKFPWKLAPKILLGIYKIPAKETRVRVLEALLYRLLLGFNIEITEAFKVIQKRIVRIIFIYRFILGICRSEKITEDRGLDALFAFGKSVPGFLWVQALDAVYEAKDEFSLTRGIINSKSHIPESLLPNALEISISIQDKECRLAALVALAERTPDALNQVINLLKEQKDEEEYTFELVSLLEKNPDLAKQNLDLGLEAISRVTSLEWKDDYKIWLVRLGHCLPSSQMPFLLESALRIHDQSYREEAVNALKKELSKLVSDNIGINEIEDDFLNNRSQDFSELQCSEVPIGVLKAKFIQRCHLLAKTLAVMMRERALSKVALAAPLISKSGGALALEEIEKAILEISRWWP
jgi:hypothetical protein